MSTRRRARDDHYELSETEKDNLYIPVGTDYRANRAMYDPDETQRVPKTGAWCLIMRELPAIEGGLDEHVRPGRVFFLEHSHGADVAGFLQDGTYKVVLHSPWGDVWLWPHEYRVLSTDLIVRLWQERQLTFHATRIDDARLNEITFYARSRGVKLADAAVMALGTLMAAVGWFEASPEVEEYVTLLGALGGPLTSKNHERRAASRARKTATKTKQPKKRKKRRKTKDAE